MNYSCRSQNRNIQKKIIIFRQMHFLIHRCFLGFYYNQIRKGGYLAFLWFLWKGSLKKHRLACVCLLYVDLKSWCILNRASNSIFTPFGVFDVYVFPGLLLFVLTEFGLECIIPKNYIFSMINVNPCVFMGIIIKPTLWSDLSKKTTGPKMLQNLEMLCIRSLDFFFKSNQSTCTPWRQ